MIEYVTHEPVRFWSALTAIVVEAIALAEGFGLLAWTPDQIALVLGMVAAVGGLFQFFYVRDRVTPLARPRSAEGEILAPVKR